MKNIPVAMRESLEKMKGSMLLSMAKGMTSQDAEAMARHWGYTPKMKFEQQRQESPPIEKHVPTITPIPDRIALDLPGLTTKNTAIKEVFKHESSAIPTIATEQTVVSEVVADVKSPESSSEKTIASNEVSKLKDLNYHPIFGKRVANLGYKSVYLTSVSSLAKTQVWERQRTLRPDRAARIAASKIALGRTKSLSGVITMFCDKVSGQSGIVDGQHRAGALMLLSQGGHWDGLEQNILIDVFETENDEQIVALFKEINSAEPVRLVDMPGEVNVLAWNQLMLETLSTTVEDSFNLVADESTSPLFSFLQGASAEVKDIIDSTMTILTEVFSEMFKPSLRCKPPHLHEAIFRDEVFQSEIIVRRNMKSSADLENLVRTTNEEYSKRSDEEWEKILLQNGLFKSNGKLLTDAIKKARTNNFFLGLDSSWMHAR